MSASRGGGRGGRLAKGSKNSVTDNVSIVANNQNCVCNKCNKDVISGDKSIQCEICQGWAHASCFGINDQGWEVLKLNEVLWVCGGCRGRLDDKIRILKLEDRQTEMELDVSKFKLEQEFVIQEFRKNFSDIFNKIDSNKNDVDIKIEEFKNSIGNLKNDSNIPTNVNSENSNCPNASNVNCINLCTRRDIVEEIEIDKRKGNLIFKGIKETQNGEEIIKKVVTKLIGEEGESIISGVTRVGKVREGFNRPIRVVFNNAEKRGIVLSKASTLNGGEFKTIYISPDLTPKQQLQDKTLRTKLKEFREGNVENIKIKRGNIVQKNREGTEVIIFSLGQTTQGQESHQIAII